jgi:PPOX class probable F420-dependent enzyme
MLVAGTWALASPSTLADVVGFDRAGEHFLHDAGAVQLGIGTGLFLAMIWRDPLTVVLTSLLIANTAHALIHPTDLHLGGRRASAGLLAVMSLVIAAALLRRLRRGGWVFGAVCAATDPALAPFETQKTVVVATFRRSGAGVATPVSLAVTGGRAVFRTFASSGKAARLRHDPRVLIAPSTARGRVVGPSIPGRARLLDGPEAGEAARVLRRKYPVLHGVLVPLAHRLLRRRVGRTIHFEITPDVTPRW